MTLLVLNIWALEYIPVGTFLQQVSKLLVTEIASKSSVTMVTRTCSRTSESYGT